MRKLTVRHESWPIAGSFTISRGSKTSAEVVVVTLEEDGAVGRGECVPYARYGETLDGVMAALEAARPRIEAGLGRDGVADVLEPKAARNALDCALWDLEAKRSGQPVWKLLGRPEAPRPLVTAYTLSLDTAEAMRQSAEKAAHRPLLKVKLGRGESDIERLRAIRAGAPASRLIVDANEGWKPEELPALLDTCAELGVVMVEQPLPAGNDGALVGMRRAVPVCADESAHDRHGLGTLLGKYDAINIKLDKTGGLTEALALAEAARAEGLQLMVGCMVSTSLSMAPAMLVARDAAVVDLDGPLLLARDREPGIRFEGSNMFWAPRELWG
ncbi:N-acetyl-D-Glu racemase DgcA [Pyxidicoccus xibeiensis]|uniref:N-acetyl-D-Glu racemase DgcA n=1 Tax=Pyxidicoccus xibeiensis TaxID=2906759 RepID=UPI0020A763F2|nr:N-acetyl-D-Glu racemase DgcA [Pyxidicoccus xibeiensis]MCP3140668.1 dipeptide epimerase [Pyxidicoccus xibeiensis]